MLLFLLASMENEKQSIRKRVGCPPLCHDKGPIQKDDKGQVWLVDKNFSKWLDNTTVHGIAHIFKGKSTVKRVFWLVIFLGALAGCVYNVLNRLKLLISNPTSTSTKIITSQEGVPFPAITICNLNPFAIAALEEYNVSDLFDFIDSASDNNDDDIISTYLKCDDHLSKVPAAIRKKPFKDLQTRSHVPLSEFITVCVYSNDNMDCNLQFKPIITNYGLCYIFNDDPNNARLVYTSGQSYGLHLYINIHQDLYDYSINGDAGIKISVTRQGALPEPDEQGIAVAPGSYAYIGLKAERAIDTTNRGECMKENGGLDFFPDYEYSQTGCRIDAYISSTLRECGCIESIAAVEGSDFGPECTIDHTCCITFHALNFTSESCKVECDRLVYTASTSYAQFPSKLKAQKLASEFNVSVDYVYTNFVGASIYFESVTKQETTTVNSYSISAFLSDLGGQLGLFLGASVISMLECGLFCIDEIKALFCTKRMKKKVRRFEKWAHVPEVTDEIERGENMVEKHEQSSELLPPQVVRKESTLKEIVKLNEKMEANVNEN